MSRHRIAVVCVEQRERSSRERACPGSPAYSRYVSSLLRLEFDPVLMGNLHRRGGRGCLGRLGCTVGILARLAQIVAAPILREALTLVEAAVAVLPSRLAANTELARAAINAAAAGAAGATAAVVPVDETLLSAADRVVARHAHRDTTRATTTPTRLTILSATTLLTTTATTATTASPAASVSAV
jgi:hypothetical protein